MAGRLSPRGYACTVLTLPRHSQPTPLHSCCRPAPNLRDGANELPWGPLRIVSAFSLVRVALLFEKDVHELLAVAMVYLAHAGAGQWSESGSVTGAFNAWHGARDTCTVVLRYVFTGWFESCRRRALGESDGAKGRVTLRVCITEQGQKR